MPIYTRTGDKGYTRIYGTRDKVSKTDRRFGALGSLDELASQLGLVSSHLPDGGAKDKILRIQRELFEIGSELATAPSQKPPFKLGKSAISRLERWVDFYWKDLPPLANFIFPGGTVASSHAHVARTVCRRAERECISFASENKVNENILAYLNRLSDFLLALARFLNHKEGVEDVVWKSKK